LACTHSLGTISQGFAKFVPEGGVTVALNAVNVLFLVKYNLLLATLHS